jgi:hypothetical protein
MWRMPVSLATLAALAGCARTAAPADECTGAAPTCFESIAPATGCCAEAGVPAECGPKDAPRGTLLKWVCPGKTVRDTECSAYGAVCATHVDQVAPSLATPHAVPFDDPGAGLPAGWQDASAGTTLVDQTEPLGNFYTVRKYTTRAAGPDGVKEHRDVYFGKERITERRYFLAPTSDYILFEDGPNKIAVHGAVSGKRRDATPKPYEAPAGATFDVQKRTVVVTFARHAPLTVRLP